MKDKNVFLTDDITIKDFDHEAIDRYDFTRQKLIPGDYNFPDFIEWMEEHADEEYFDADEAYRKDFEEWADDNLSFEEVFEVPMMNVLRYFPDFVEFSEEDRRKVSGATTLLYDNELGAWAVGMTGGGMDLAPHLVDTFIELGKGVPLQLAKNITPKYRAYVDRYKHADNCELLAEAFDRYADSMKHQANILYAN